MILTLVQNKIVLKNSSDSYGQVSWSDESFFLLVKRWKWPLVGQKRLKFQFEDYWEPNWFKAFILFAWIMIWLARESTAYRSKLLAFDQKGLYQVCNVGFGYWLWRKWICCRLKKCLRDFKTRDHLCLFLDLLSLGFVFSKIVVMPPSVGFGLFSLFSLFLFGWAQSYQLFVWEAQIF